MSTIHSRKDGMGLSRINNRPLPGTASRLTSSIEIMITQFGVSEDDINSLTPIGFIQSFNVKIGREFTNVFEAGIHKMVEMVPSALQLNEISVKRVFLYKSRLLEAFDPQTKKGRGTVLWNTRPFDILVVEKLPVQNGGKTRYPGDPTGEGSSDSVKSDRVIQHFYGCWFSANSYDVGIDNFTFQIIDEATIKYMWVD